MFRPVQLAIATPLIAVLAAGGCGRAADSNSASKFDGAQKPVAQAIEDFQKAAEKGDERKICDTLITAKLKAQIARANSKTAKDCAQAMSEGLNDTDQSDLTVTAVKLAGPTAATATVKQKLSDRKSRSTSVKLEKVGTSWRIAELPA